FFKKLGGKLETLRMARHQAKHDGTLQLVALRLHTPNLFLNGLNEHFLFTFARAGDGENPAAHGEGELTPLCDLISRYADVELEVAGDANGGHPGLLKPLRILQSLSM